MEGQTLALDVPNSGPDLLPFLAELDQIVLKHGGRVYLAKDACLSPQAFAQMYPRLEEFRRSKRELDPQSLFNSSLARRLQITEEP
jgi:FAD/FMN-containing dehydrogenase